MIKALASRHSLSEPDSDVAYEFYCCVSDIINAPEFLRLDDYCQHKGFSRRDHCVNVAYYSFLFCRKLDLDAKSAARGGLLHDLYHYDWRGKCDKRQHILLHPRIALKNARKITPLNDIERDIIQNHMWPFSKLFKYRETFVVTLVDKFAAVMELSSTLFKTTFKDSIRLY